MRRSLAVLALLTASATARAQDGGVATTAAPPPAKLPSPWSLFRAPTKRPAQAIGGYSAGCIDGAVALPLSGNGFRVARPERNRIFGHPVLVGMIEELGRRLRALGLPPLVVGDLGQPRGGPAPTGHACHQTGLDVDLLFLPTVDGHAVSMVDTTRTKPTARFTAAVMRMLELAASDPRVDRIFIHPALKRAVCERTAGAADRSWLQKIRPWWGHDDHFHVRLACPADSPACVAQPPLPPGDGCGELAWWFDKKAQADREKSHQTYASKVGAAPALPDGCRALLDP